MMSLSDDVIPHANSHHIRLIYLGIHLTFIANKIWAPYIACLHMGILTVHIRWQTGHTRWTQGENDHKRWEIIMQGRCEVGIATKGNFAKVYKGKLLKIFIICAFDITEATSHP